MTGLRLLPLFLLITAGCAASRPTIYYPAKKMVVTADVADVRAQKIPHSGRYEYDPLQETQLERGEPVLALEQDGGWIRVQCIEQMEFTHNQRWEGYPGWVRADALAADGFLQRKLARPEVPDEELRGRVLAEASKHLGSRYLWGGKSLHNPGYTETVTGVDCSGLIHWSFREVGILVPRDAHEQFMKAKRLEASDVKPGDLIFLAAKDKPDKVVHVMFYAGEEMILEAPLSGERVRRLKIRERLGTNLADLKNGQAAGDRVVYMGTLFQEAK